MIEVVQGEGGVIPLTQEFVQGRCASIAAEQDLLLICDEVQIGNGRSGKLYGYMHYGIIRPTSYRRPRDSRGGLPLGATLLGEKVQDVLTPGSHGSTFGGNPDLLRRRAEHSCDRLDEKPARCSPCRRSPTIHRQGSHRRHRAYKSVTGLGPDARRGDRKRRRSRTSSTPAWSSGVLVISAKEQGAACCRRSTSPWRSSSRRSACSKTSAPENKEEHRS